MARRYIRLLPAVVLTSASVFGCDGESADTPHFQPIEYEDLVPTGKADAGGPTSVGSLRPGDRLFVGNLNDRSFELDLRAGETVEIGVRAVGRLGGVEPMQIAIFDPHGQPVADLETEDGDISELVVSAETDGVYRVGLRGWANLYDVRTRCAECEEDAPTQACTDTVTYFAGAPSPTLIDYDIDIDSCSVVGTEATLMRFEWGEQGTREVRIRPGARVRGWEHMNFSGRGFLRVEGTAEAPIVFEDYSDDYATVVVNLPSHMRYVNFGRANVHVNADLHLEDAVLHHGGRFDKKLVINGSSATIERSLLDGFSLEIHDYENADVHVFDSVIKNVTEAVKVPGRGSECGGSSGIPWPRVPFSGDPQIVRSDIYAARYALVVHAPTQVVVQDSNLVGGYHTIRLDVDGLAFGSQFVHSNITNSGSPIKLESRNPGNLLSLFEDVYLGDAETSVLSHCSPLPEKDLDVASRTDAWIEGLGPNLNGLRDEVAQAVYRK